MLRALVCTIFLTLGACTVSTAPSTSEPAPTQSTAQAPQQVDVAAFTQLINETRRINGASPLRFDPTLAKAAQGHADDMLERGFFSHRGSNGSKLTRRVTRAGYRWTKVGENIAQGQSSEAELMQAWTNSPGHHANNIDPGFTEFGIAKAGAGAERRWVLVLARP